MKGRFVVAVRGTTLGNQQSSSWGIDVVLWGLLVLLLAPLVIAMQGLPWAGDLSAWVIPVTLISGLAIGGILVAIVAPRRWWQILLNSVLLLTLAGVLGAQLISHGTLTTHPVAGAVLMGAFLTFLGATVPWLIFHARQAWIAVALVWVAIVGAWGGDFTAQRALQLVWLLVISLALIGLFRLREEMHVWQAQHLERLGPVLWPTARTILLITLLVALVGLIPIGVVALPSLQHLFRNTPLAQGGPLSFDSPSGTPVAVLGAPLGMNAPDVSSNATILTYQILGSTPPIIPPLLGATLDTFDGTTWSLGAVTSRQPASADLSPAQDATTIQMRVTLATLPPTANTSLLLGFSNPVGFSVPSQVHVVAGTAPGWDTITDWQPSASLHAGMTYSTSSVIVSGSDAATGTLDPALASRMQAVPPALQLELQSQAQAMVGSAITPAAKATALLNKMAATMKLAPLSVVPAGAEPINWFLTHKVGNTILWTTTYILLARSLGLPMRLAEGYLPGHYDTKTGMQVVRASDATVWAQLAIPGRGWLDLFPVANVQTIVVPGTIIIQANDTPVPQPTVQVTPLPKRSTQPNGVGSTTGTALQFAFVAIVSILLIIVIIGLFLRMRWANIGKGLPPLSRAFAQLAWLARFAGIRLRTSDTATQATEKVAEYLPQQRETLTTLNRSYERFVYGAPEQRSLLPQLGKAWQHLSSMLWQFILRRPWRRAKPAARP